MCHYCFPCVVVSSFLCRAVGSEPVFDEIEKMADSGEPLPEGESKEEKQFEAEAEVLEEDGAWYSSPTQAPTHTHHVVLCVRLSRLGSAFLCS